MQRNQPKCVTKFCKLLREFSKISTADPNRNSSELTKQQHKPACKKARETLVRLHHQRIDIDRISRFTLDRDGETTESDGSDEGGEPADDLGGDGVRQYRRWIG